MNQPPALAFNAFADVWPRATETEISAALCAIGAGRTLTFLESNNQMRSNDHTSAALRLIFAIDISSGIS